MRSRKSEQKVNDYFLDDMIKKVDAAAEACIKNEARSEEEFYNKEREYSDLTGLASLLKELKEFRLSKEADQSHTPQEKEVTIEATRDLLRFLDGKIAIYIADSSEYLGFIHHLQKAGVKLFNACNYQDDPAFYDPKYPYFYMEIPAEGYMNANEKYENIVEYTTHCPYPIEDCLNYEDLDFVKEPEREEQEEEWELE